MVSEVPSQTEGRMQIPSVVAAAISAIEVDLGPLAILDVPPNLRPLEVLKEPPEEHVAALLFHVDASWPVTNVEAVAAEAAVEELVALLAAQVPGPRGQMRPHRPADLLSFSDSKLAADCHRDGLVCCGGGGGGGFGVVVDGVEVEIVVERPGTVRRRRRRRLGSGVGGGGGGLGLVVGAELAFEAEVGVVEEDAGVEEAGAADGELVEGGPAAWWGVGGGDDGGEGGEALGLAADVANEGGEFGAGAGEAGPVPRVVLKFVEDVQNDVVREPREHFSNSYSFCFCFWFDLLLLLPSVQWKPLVLWHFIFIFQFMEKQKTCGSPPHSSFWTTQLFWSINYQKIMFFF